MKYLNEDSKDNFINNFDCNNYDDDENILKFLLEQNENNIKIINESKKEIEKLQKIKIEISIVNYNYIKMGVILF